MKPIVEIRAVNFTWVESNPNAPGAIIDRSAWLLEIRREGETEWVRIPIVEIMGAP
jgi:hypothetical protein